MQLINCEVNLILTWYQKCVVSSNALAAAVATFAITNTNLFVQVVISSTYDNAKLFEQLKSVLKRRLTGINMNQKNNMNSN